MSNYDLSQVPSYVVMALEGNTALYNSPLIASAQTLDRGGLKWAAVYTYSNVHEDNRGDLLGTIALLRGQAHRLRVPVYDNPKRGAYGGTPLVAGASQTGSSINLDGCTASVTGWIKKGDYFSVDVNGEHELKMATADANSDGTGAITISFEPRLRASPLDNAAVYVEDGVLAKPRGIFVMRDASVNWSSVPGTKRRSTLTLDLVEDVFATQS